VSFLALSRLIPQVLQHNRAGEHMADDTKKRGGQDRARINVNEDYELRDCAKSLGVPPERVKEAVQAVGDRADKVREFLQGGDRR
jgi:hypothetical protein